MTDRLTLETLREIARQSGLRHAEFCLDQEASQRGGDYVAHLRAEFSRLVQRAWGLTMDTTQHAPDDTQDETYTPDWAGPWVVAVVIAGMAVPRKGDGTTTRTTPPTRMPWNWPGSTAPEPSIGPWPLPMPRLTGLKLSALPPMPTNGAAARIPS